MHPVKPLLTALFLLILAVGTASADSLEIGRWRVALWPEYDDAGALVIYDGRFVDPSAFPAKTRFILPKGVVVSDACSLSPGGEHFCQIYKIIDKGSFDEIELWLPFPNFYVSFHLPPTDTAQEQRQLDFLLQINHRVERLEVDIQEPLRSQGFALTPDKQGELSERKGFKHHLLVWPAIKVGEKLPFGIRYVKTDARPSVDIKFSRMSAPKIWGSPYDKQKKATFYLYVMFGLAVTLLVLAVVLFIWKKRSASALIILFCLLSLSPVWAEESLTVNDVAHDLACPCTCPLILEDCNMSCGLEWKEQVGTMIAAGKTKAEIMDYFYVTYGDKARLTPWQRVEGKVYQYTRGFGDLEWAMLWGGLGLWALLLAGGIIVGVRKFHSKPKTL